MKTRSRQWVNVNVYTAIGFGVDRSTGEQLVVKYRNIGKGVATRIRFEKFLKGKFEGMQYINYYDPITRKFEFRTTYES